MTDSNEETEVALDARPNIKSQFALIEQLTHNLISIMEPDDQAPHFVYPLPTRDTKESTGDILVRKISGLDAWERALEMYAQYYRAENQHPMATIRLPGLVYAKNIQEIRPLVEELNLAKKELKTMITKIESHQRHRLTTEVLPGVITLQVYRKILLVDEQMRRFVFSWAKRTAGSQKVTVEEVLARIESDIEAKIKDTGELFADISLAQLKGEKALIESLDRREQLRYYRLLAVHPRLMGFDIEGNTDYALNYHANLPVITKYHPETRVRALPNFIEHSKPSKTRKDFKQKTLLIPRLYLYALTEWEPP